MNMSSELVWLRIPLYPDYWVSNRGDQVWSDKSKAFLSLTVNKYGYVVTSIRDKKKNKLVRVHRLVCMAFHGLVKGFKKLHVNHKDGIKTNNAEDNLEWATSTENNIHASDTGLRKETIRVMVIDHQLGTERIFYSLGSVRRHFGFKYDIDTHKLFFKKGLYLDRYEVYRLSHGNIKRDTRIGIYGYDFKTSNFHNASSLLEMSLGIEINIVNIRRALKRQGLVNGVYFWLHGDEHGKDKLKEFDDAAVTKSVATYLAKTGAMDETFNVHNYCTGLTDTFPTQKDVSLHTGLSINQIHTVLKSKGKYPVRGYFITKGDNFEFPQFSDELIEASTKGVIRRGNPVAVLNVNTNETVCWPSLHHAAKEMGLHMKTLKRRLDSTTHDDYRVRFISD